jgi:NitT/TauT family transport system permease protein
VAGVAIALAAWWAAIELLAPPTSLIARFAPADGLATLAHLLGDPRLHQHVAASLRRIVGGLGIAAAVGIPIGLAVGSAQLIARTTGPVFGLLRMISPLSWTPIAIILFGVGDAPVVFLVAIGATWPIVINTAAGVAGLDPTWPRVARSLGATRGETLRHVVWPGIRAEVMTGLRVATGLAWVILVPAEMLGVDSGLGYFILDARDRFAYNELTAAILIIGTLGLALDTLARLAFSPRRRTSRSGRPLARTAFDGTPSPGAVPVRVA